MYYIRKKMTNNANTSLQSYNSMNKFIIENARKLSFYDFHFTKYFCTGYKYKFIFPISIFKTDFSVFFPADGARKILFDVI